MQATYQKGTLQAVVFEHEGLHLKGSELSRAYSGNSLAKTIEAQRDQVQQQRVALGTAGQQYGQHRVALDLEAFGRAYAAQQQAEKDQQQAQERTAPQQAPQPPRPTIERSGGYGIGD